MAIDINKTRNNCKLDLLDINIIKPFLTKSGLKKSTPKLERIKTFSETGTDGLMNLLRVMLNVKAAQFSKIKMIALNLLFT
ncbi:MAG: hypothetical protein BGO68_01605 [Candidatus Amoebophilus sp. 36-38]|nr:MAG: hypothetical protein BGO68_01605 [Candidatus Amoebophilus sp. 36-38]